MTLIKLKITTSYNVEQQTQSKNDVGWTPLLALVCLAITIGAVIPVGYNMGVLNTPAVFIKSWCKDMLIQQYDVHLNESQLQLFFSLVVSIFLIGGILGSFGGAWMCDKFGRKGCLLISASLFVFSGLLFNFCHLADSVEMLLCGRLVAGVASAFVFTAQPMYLMELAPVELRDGIGVFTAIGVTGGIVVGQVLSLHQVFGTSDLWPYALSFSTLLVLVCFAPSYWFPESPRWLYAVRGDIKGARTEIVRLRGNEVRADREIAEMETAVLAKSNTTNSSGAEKISFYGVLRNPEYLLPLMLVCLLPLFQQLAGVNAIFYYSIAIFTKAGFSADNAAWMNLGAGILNVAVAALGPILTTRYNRRPLYISSCTACGLSLITLSLGLYFIDLFTWLPIICIISIATYIIWFNVGMGPIPYFIGSELFEVGPRPVAMSLASLFSWIGNFIIGMFFPLLQDAVGAFAFIPCSVVCVLAILFTFIYLPETRGREPSEVAPSMKNGLKSKVR